MQKNWLGLLGSAAAALWLGQAHAADLTIWGLQAFNPAADAYIGELVEEYGTAQGIDAEYVVVPANVLNEKLAAAFAAGSPPDAFMQVSAQGLYYMSEGLTAPLDDVLADMRKVPGGIYENTMPQATYDGRVAGAADRGRRFADVRPQGSARQGRHGHPDDLGGAPRCLAGDPEGRSDHPAVRPAGQQRQRRRGPDPADHLVVRRRHVRARTARPSPSTRRRRTRPTSSSPTWWPRARSRATRCHLGRRRQQQRLPDRPRRLRRQSAEHLCVDAGQRQGAARQHRADQPAQGTRRRRARPRPASARGCGWCRRARSRSTHAKGWLRYFFEPTRYQKIIDTVGGRWLPIYPEMMSMPLFKDNPDYANFGAMAESGIIDGYEGPPTAHGLEGQQRQDRDAGHPEDPRRRHVHRGCRRLGSGGDREDEVSRRD